MYDFGCTHFFISGDKIEGLLYSIDSENQEYFIIKNPRKLDDDLALHFYKISNIYIKCKLRINFFPTNDLQGLKCLY